MPIPLMKWNYKYNDNSIYYSLAKTDLIALQLCAYHDSYIIARSESDLSYNV